jgi:hypothetical protein
MLMTEAGAFGTGGRADYEPRPTRAGETGAATSPNRSRG